jgi:sirohydrochlorin ferrochelatase
MTATLLVAAHGTRSPAGLATTRALLAAVAAARAEVPVELCFLDVAEPSLPAALDALAGRDVVVVPLLLSAGYHVTTDIPEAVRGRDRVRVAKHLGPDPAVIEAVAGRLLAARGALEPATTLLAAIASSRDGANAEVALAAERLAGCLGRPVSLLPLIGDLRARLDAVARPVEVAVYLLAEGGFLDALANAGADMIADPIRTAPELVRLVWDRYDAVTTA